MENYFQLKKKRILIGISICTFEEEKGWRKLLDFFQEVSNDRKIPSVYL
jgi:hypothetical protein